MWKWTIYRKAGQRWARRATGFLLVLALLAGGALIPIGDAQASPAEKLLFIHDVEPAIAGAPAEVALEGMVASRSRPVTINPQFAVEDGFAAGDTIALNLFADRHYTATVDRVTVNVNGTISVRARIEGYPFGYLLVSTTEGRSLGSIVVPEKQEHYLIMSPTQRDHFLLEIVEFAPVERHPPLIPPPPTREEAQEIEELQRRVAEEGLGPDDPAEIDVMVVYTPAAESWAATRGGIANIVAQAMGDAQLTLDNSNTGVTMTLVHSAEVDYTEDNTDTDLRRLTWRSGQWAGHMDEVHDWRDEYGADLVALFADYGGWIMGLAWVLTYEWGRPDLGFSVTSVQGASAPHYVHIHEMGHNMGCGHHKLQGGARLFDYSAGWRWTGSDNTKYSSVMTYGWGDTRVAHFSNPNVNHQGQPTGHAADGDNARTIREIKHVIAAYRERPPVEEVHIPDANLEAAVRGELGKPTGPITVTDMESLTNLYADNRGIVSLVGLEHAINLKELNLGEGLYGTPATNEISDLGPLAGLTELEYLLLHGNEISDVGPLAGLTNLKWLCLGRNHISDLGPLAGLTNLKWLRLGNNQISDLGPLAGLTELEYLLLHGNEISDVGPLGGLANLWELNLAGNRISDASPLFGLSHLQVLWLSWNLIDDLSSWIEGDGPGWGTWCEVYIRNNFLDMNEAAWYQEILLVYYSVWLWYDPQRERITEFQVRRETGDVLTPGAFHGLDFRAGGADLAEWVSVSEPVEPGHVLEIDPTGIGQYRLAQGPCTVSVAGVVSTAPGIVLGSGFEVLGEGQAMLALLGVVPVKVTDEGGPIAVGDLLIVSSTPGHAMRWDADSADPCALVGKALEPHEEGEGIIEVLLTR